MVVGLQSLEPNEVGLQPTEDSKPLEMGTYSAPQLGWREVSTPYSLTLAEKELQYPISAGDIKKETSKLVGEEDLLMEEAAE